MSTSQPIQSELKELVNFSEQVGHMPPETRMVKRAVDLLVRPQQTWRIIAEESGGLKEAFLPYSIVIGLIPGVIGMVLSTALWGMFYAFMGTAGMGFAGTVFHSAVGFIYEVVGILVSAKILELIAPSFGLRKSWVLSCRVLVYGGTPMYLAGIVMWIPFIGSLLGLVAILWSFHMIFQGAQIVLKRNPPAAVREPKPARLEASEPELAQVP